jgi:hypothetical protein
MTFLINFFSFSRIIFLDGQIVSFCPPLPSRASMAFPLQAAVVRDRQLPTAASNTSRAADCASLLAKAALGEVRLLAGLSLFPD